MTSDLRARLADARLYLCTGSRRSRGDLPEFLDAVLGAGVDIVQLREKGLEAGEELGLLEVFAAACLATRQAAGRERPRGRRARRRGRRAPPGTGRPAGAGRAPHPRPGPAHRPRQPQPGPVRRGGRRTPAWITSAASPLWTTPTKPGRPATGLDLHRHVAGQHPELSRGSRSAASAWTGWTTCWPPGPPGWSWSRHYRGGRSRRRDPGVRQPPALTPPPVIRCPGR